MQPSDNRAAAGNNFPLETSSTAELLAGSVSGRALVNLECTAIIDYNVRVCN